ncbi:FkbM family methyltransferase [Synechococcus sp. UW140]|uniref:FkbM family methyltransferase n=1 Tax=Synechococcus sp. UW140 TaxID=368503 RepID=UPI0031381D51
MKISYGPLILHLPEGHPLPQYQQLYPFYDRLLPILVRRLSSAWQSPVLIDIGANIGDTTIQCCAVNDNLSVLAVEPNADFAKMLWKNIEANDLYRAVVVSTDIVARTSSAYLAKKSGSLFTGDVIEADPKASAQSRFSKTIYEIIAEINIEPSNIVFVKSDTDGNDAQIVESFCDCLERCSSFKPLGLWFEAQPYANDLGVNDPSLYSNLDLLKQSLERLVHNGYKYFAAIDNYGVPIMQGVDHMIINSLMQYSVLSRTKGQTLPFYFVDIVSYRNLSDMPDLPTLLSKEL